MNKNVKIAKDLIRIAKSLISNEQINKQNLIQKACENNDYDTLFTYMHESGMEKFFTPEQRKQLINLLIKNDKPFQLKYLVIDNLDDEEKKIVFQYFKEEKFQEGLEEFLFGYNRDLISMEQKFEIEEMFVGNNMSVIFEAWDHEFTSEEKEHIIKLVIECYDDDDNDLQELWRKCNNNQKKFWNEYVKSINQEQEQE